MTIEDSLLNKIMSVALGASALGRPINIKIRGTSAEIESMSSALTSTKNFHEELARPGATVESVMKRLNAKHESVKECESALGCRWPL